MQPPMMSWEGYVVAVVVWVVVIGFLIANVDLTAFLIAVGVLGLSWLIEKGA
jgi:hypothetical protein